MGFLKRLLGGQPVATAAEPPPGPSAAMGDELDRERELLLEDAHRLDDDLLQRQLRYADRSWTPPPQGGARRADDEEASGGQ